MKIAIDEEITLELTAMHHAAGLLKAVSENRDHLGRYLSWVPWMQSSEDFESYIRNCQRMYADRKELSFVIFLNGTVVGRIGIHHINTVNETGEIGYWLVVDATGRGIITKSCRWLISYGFEKMKLHRIIIKAATSNQSSQNIPRHLGFSHEGTLREAEKVNQQFYDIDVYAMLCHEWKTPT